MFSSRRKRRFSFFNTDPEHTDKVMEVNNVQLEGRRINVEISKMMVAEDVITTEEVLVVVVLGGRSSAPRREGSFAPREKVQAVVEATETQVLEKVDLWKKLCSKRGFGGRSSAQR
jgi:ATP-dependent RNA helicase DeaD